MSKYRAIVLFTDSPACLQIATLENGILLGIRLENFYIACLPAADVVHTCNISRRQATDFGTGWRHLHFRAAAFKELQEPDPVRRLLTNVWRLSTPTKCGSACCSGCGSAMNRGNPTKSRAVVRKAFDAERPRREIGGIRH